MRIFDKIAALVILNLICQMIVAQAPINWEINEQYPGNDITLTPDDAIFSEGEKSCLLTLKSERIPYLISQVFQVTPGTDYVFSIDILDQDTSGTIRVYADFYDSYGFDVFGESPINSIDSISWQTISWSGQVPAQAVVGYVMIKSLCQPNPDHFAREAIIWIDNIRFVNESGQNLLANGGFESWITGEHEAPAVHDLEVYPNPGNDFFQILVPQNVTFLDITSISGRQLFSLENPLKGLLSLRLPEVDPGIYFIRICLPSGEITKKLIKR